MIGPCFAMHFFVAFYFCNHLAQEEIAGCCTLIVFLLALLVVFSALSRAGLQCVTVAFPGHTNLCFEVHYT